MWAFYRYNREVNRYLHSNDSVSRSGYLRLLAIGCIDIIFSLPSGILSLLSVVGVFYEQLQLAINELIRQYCKGR